MKSIHDSDKFFNHELKYHNEKAKSLSSINPRSAAHHQETVEWFNIISAFVQEKLKDESSSESLNKPENEDLFHLNPLELEELPEELRKELSVTPSDTQDAQLLELLKIAGRPLNLNELLIASHRKHNMNYKRPALTARLYRLISSEKVYSPSKGIYELADLENYDYVIEDENNADESNVSEITKLNRRFDSKT